MADIPQATSLVLSTGAVTILTTVVTQIFVMRIEAKKAAREDARAAQKRRDEWQLKQRENKAAKLGELWLAIELASERLSDTQLAAKMSDGTDMPQSKDLAANGTNTAYGIALLHFPDLRPFVYAFHAETVKYEAGLWFDKLEDEDALLERWRKLRTELADAIENKARELQADL